MLPASLAKKEAIELGCGTTYVSGCLARRDARMVGIDNSEAQLATARRLQRVSGPAKKCGRRASEADRRPHSQQ
jgi:trans-aconitate methyltransferase